MKMQIQCYKHNGRFHRSWEEVTVIEETEDMIVVGVVNPSITEKDTDVRKPKETNIMFFYKKSFYNIIARYQKKGLFYKVNIASPYLIDDNAIKFIDYDLDLKVFPNGAFKVLDKNEYKFHKKIMKYSSDLDVVLKDALSEVINMKKNNEGPFDEAYLKKYYDKLVNN